MVSLRKLRASPENEKLYRPVLYEDPEVIALAESISKHGVQEPLVITKDGYIVSGHRRRVAAALAGLSKVPCRRLKICREGNRRFLQLLRECNRQRVKTRSEQLREEAVSANAKDAYHALTRLREKKANISLQTVEIRKGRARAAISKAKTQFLNACKSVIERLRKYWPLADRQIHYQLLNDPPLIHASKPGSRYRNDRASYKSLVDLLTRARHAGLIRYEVIADATRPVANWNVSNSVADYYREQFKEILTGYWRNLMQSQPNHLEIVAEKLTVQSIVEPVAARYCIPLTIGRGFCSTRPLYDIAQRFKASGKTKLIVLSISDLDPDGDEITHSLARRLRDDFDIEEINAVKVALTAEQRDRLHLPPNSERAKRTSANYRRYVERYGSDEVFELESLPPATLATLLSDAIDSVLDIDAFNAEVHAEREDASQIIAVRSQILSVLRDAEGLE